MKIKIGDELFLSTGGHYPESVVLKCVPFIKDRTNADRIRAISDEELADFIVNACLDSQVRFCKNKPECMAILERNECIPTEMCRKCALDWLRQPAEGSENE